jgi:uncharacterized membrane protein
MSPSVYLLVMTAHVLGMVLWISGLTAIYWMLRFHDHAPKSAHEQLTLQERALALATDIAATVTIGCGIAMAVSPVNLFSTPGNGWLHVKLTAIVLLILPVHGILRGRIKKYSQGILKPAPTWLWSMLLGGIAIAIFSVVTKLHVFTK